MLDPEQIAAIEAGIDGITLITDIAAYIEQIDMVNGETQPVNPDEEVESPVTVENIVTHVRYYNGETYQEWLSRFINENI